MIKQFNFKQFNLALVKEVKSFQESLSITNIQLNIALSFTHSQMIKQFHFKQISLALINCFSPFKSKTVLFDQ